MKSRRGARCRATRKFPVIHNNQRDIQFKVLFATPGQHTIAIGTAPYTSVRIEGERRLVLYDALTVSDTTVPVGAGVRVSSRVASVADHGLDVKVPLQVDGAVAATHSIPFWAGWPLQGIADLDGDGSKDALYSGPGGQQYAVYLNGFVKTGQGYVSGQSADAVGALFHDSQSHVFARLTVAHLAGDALAVVFDEHVEDLPGLATDHHAHVLRATVLADVGQRLLHDAEHFHLLSRAQVQHVATILKKGRDAGVISETGHAIFDGRDQTAGIHGRAEARQQFSQTRVGLIEGHLQPPYFVSGGASVFAVQDLAEHFDLQAHAHQGLCQGIVQLAAQDVPFLHDGQTSCIFFQSGLFQGQAHVAAHAGQQVAELRTESDAAALEQDGTQAQQAVIVLNRYDDQFRGFISGFRSVDLESALNNGVAEDAPVARL